MTTGIYCITSPTGKTYIGSSINIERRWREYKRLKCIDQTAIYNSLIKHGANNHKFEIICLCDREQLIKKEQMFIDFFKPDLNICKVAGSTLGYKHSDESKKKMSSLKKGIKKEPLSDEHKNKIRISQKQAKKIYQYDKDNNLIQIFDTITQAANSVNGKRSNLRDVCNGKYKTSYGYIWSWF